jgi:hypothetical protein
MKLEYLKKLCEEATPWVEGENVGISQGDVARRLTPDSDLNLNTYGAWIFGPNYRSRKDAQTDLDYTVAARTMLPKLIAVVEAAKKIAAVSHPLRDPTGRWCIDVAREAIAKLESE